MTKLPTILGLGGSDHDVHACLLVGDTIRYFIEEERISRRKYGLGGDLLAGLARRYCLEAAGIELKDVDLILRDDILAAPAWYPLRNRVQVRDHHMCHAAASYYTSDFDRAGVLVVDNAGGLYTDDADGTQKLQATSWFWGEGRDLTLMDRVGSTNWKDGPLFRGEPYQRGDGDHSIGHFYKKLTGALGFRYPRGAKATDFYFPEDGVTMGLASYGDARPFADRLTDLFTLEDGGHYRLPLSNGAMDALLADIVPEDADFQRKADVAAAGQEALTRVLCHLVDHIVAETGETRLCLSGGVAMNSVANGEILKRTGVSRLHIPFCPGDNGTGLGAVLLEAARDPDRPLPKVSVYGGRSYTNGDCSGVIDALDQEQFIVHRFDEDAVAPAVAKRLNDGKVVAVFKAGAEGGRRALGHRSLLADPRAWSMRDHINFKVKRREHFRPFAPAVRAEKAAEYFEIDQPSPYMQIVFDVKAEHRDNLEAITHVDGTARVQTVRAEETPFLDSILTAFGKLSGVEVVLNTSFNGPGEPIVETPEQAVSAFDRLGVDALLLEDTLIERRAS